MGQCGSTPTRWWSRGCDRCVPGTCRGARWRAYTDSVKRLVDHARERELDPFGRRAIEEYLATVADTRAPATVSFRHRALQQWFKWLTDEEELDVDPMAKMKPPQVPEQPVPVLTSEQMRALFATCDRGKQFIDRRDHACIARSTWAARRATAMNTGQIPWHQQVRRPLRP